MDDYIKIKYTKLIGKYKHIIKEKNHTIYHNIVHYHNIVQYSTILNP